MLWRFPDRTIPILPSSADRDSMSATPYMREYSCPKKSSSIYSDFPLVLAARAISRDYQVTPYELRSDQLIYPIKSDYIFIYGVL